MWHISNKKKDKGIILDFDQFNITENGLEYDRKKFTPTNMNGRTWPKNHTDEH